MKPTTLKDLMPSLNQIARQYKLHLHIVKDWQSARFILEQKAKLN
jgi:hypothetical protein